MTLGCADCSRCGKCYPKKRPCPHCAAIIDFENDDNCPYCFVEITEEIREQARAEFRKQKKQEKEWLFSQFKKKKG